jgi:polyphosphate glucokinase
VIHHIGTDICKVIEQGICVTIVFGVFDISLSPDMIIIGGGISKNFNMYGPLLSVKTVVKPASMMNDAGIVGAAMAAVK